MHKNRTFERIKMFPYLSSRSHHMPPPEYGHLCHLYRSPQFFSVIHLCESQINVMDSMKNAHVFSWLQATNSQFSNSLGTRVKTPALDIQHYWGYEHYQLQSLSVMEIWNITHLTRFKYHSQVNSARLNAW